MAVERKANILLVDDRPENLVALEAILTDLDQNLVKADSGKEALKQCLSREFAVILLDVQMPGMDGFETATLIREREKSHNTPIVFITAVSQDDSQVYRAYSLGAVDYVFKPIVAEVLKAKVSVFVDLFLKTEEVRRHAELLREEREQEHKLAEQLARSNAEAESSRSHLAAVLDSTVDAILTVDENGAIKSANRRTGEIFGYDDGGLLDKEISVLFSGSEVRETLASLVQSLYYGGEGGNP